MTPPPLDPVPVPVPVPVLVSAAATSAGEASFGLATTVSVRAAAVIAISCLRSVSSRAIVWLPGTASTAWATLKAPDPGCNTAAPTATPMTATAAKTAIGKTMPTRRIRPRLRLLLRFPVRCRDKAILSSGHAPPGTKRRLDAVPACRVRGPCGNRRRATHLLHLTWCAVWPASHKYRWRTTMPERPLECAGLRRESWRPVYRRTCDDNHKTITLLVTATDQAVIAARVSAVVRAVPVGPRRPGAPQVRARLRQSDHGNTLVTP